MKRATYAGLRVSCVKFISIHALVKRATAFPTCINMFHVISIHALVKRATKILKISTGAMFISIHALVKRATTILCSARAIEVYFNPRPREEGDVALKVEVGSEPNFNPRPREEGDIFNGLFAKREIISIHALVKRATLLLEAGKRVE